MSWPDLLAGVTVTAVVAPRAVGLVRVRTHRPPAAVGDPRLAATVDATVGDTLGRHVRRLAVVWIDLATDPVTRMAFVQAGVASPFEIGSVSKALTGLLVADAVDRGELTLATPLAQLDPRYRGGSCATLTVAELATHTSGLPTAPEQARVLLGGAAFGLFGTDPYRWSTTGSVVGAAGRQRLRGRGSHRYSNLGAAVLGEAVAAHAGTDYPALLAERVLHPLGMTDTGIGLPVPPGWRGSGRRARPWRMPGYRPAGAVISTPFDMAAFAEAMLRGRAPGRSATVPVAGVADISPGSRQGLFWVVTTDQATGRRQVWHNGQTGGYSAFLAVHPDAGRAVVALTDLADTRRLQRFVTRVVGAVVRA